MLTPDQYVVEKTVNSVGEERWAVQSPFHTYFGFWVADTEDEARQSVIDSIKDAEAGKPWWYTPEATQPQ